MYRQYRDISEGEYIVVGCDTSSGVKDYSTAQFISKTCLDVPLVYHNKVIATQMTNDLYPVLEQIYDITGIKPLVAYERNNGGAFEIERLAGLNRLGKYDIFSMQYPGRDNGGDVSHRLGWDTNSVTRPQMLSALKDMVDKQLIRIYDKFTIEEMFSFVIVTTSNSHKAQAEKNSHDDLVMALAIAYQLFLMSPSVADIEQMSDMPQVQYEHRHAGY